MVLFALFFNGTATTEIYTYCHTLSLHDALPISLRNRRRQMTGTLAALARLSRNPPEALLLSAGEPIDALRGAILLRAAVPELQDRARTRSEEHTSELQSLMRISYAVFCLKKKK